MSYFDTPKVGDYFDTALNKAVMQKVAAKCYLPTNELMLELIERYDGAFKIAYSLSGVAIDQMKAYSPETLESFQRLAETGCVEFLGETYYHSLSALHSGNEFEAQVDRHAQTITELFGITPRVFRNTELIYSDTIGQRVADLGFDGVIAEGADDILAWRSPNFVYQGMGSTKILLKNYRLSDDIAFRFSNRGWSQWPLTADKFAGWIDKLAGEDTINLFMDYETFGEHQWKEHGIFEFLEHLPQAILQRQGWDFACPSEVIDTYPAIADMTFPRLVSWADLERDVTAWLGNDMQLKAWNQVYAMSEQIHAIDTPEILEIWRNLQTSDHFYYMSTKWFSDGDVHAYFSPYDSPYEAFIFFQNVLRSFSETLESNKRALL